MSKKTEQSRPQPNRVYTLKITLHGSKPPIWRRVEVTDVMTLGALHATIQIAMGWEECHLHEFEIDGVRYGAKYPGTDLDLDEVENQEDFSVGAVLPESGQSFTYLYDFGDNWLHRIKVESVSEAPKADQHYPVCLAGERACPPEDSGGLWGYMQKLEILDDPDHEDYFDIAEWMGRKFDPEAFNLKAVNALLENV